MVNTEMDKKIKLSEGVLSQITEFVKTEHKCIKCDFYFYDLDWDPQQSQFNYDPSKRTNFPFYYMDHEGMILWVEDAYDMLCEYQEWLTIKDVF